MEPVAAVVALLFLLAALVYVERTSAWAAEDIQRQTERQVVQAKIEADR